MSVKSDDGMMVIIIIILFITTMCLFFNVLGYIQVNVYANMLAMKGEESHVFFSAAF